MYKLIRAEKERYVFQQLFNEYVEELGQYDAALLETADRFGDYLPDEFNEFFHSPAKRPYVIKEGKEMVGIVVFSRAVKDDEDDICDIYVEELYIAAPYRRRGIAAAVVEDYFAENGGRTCGMCVYKENDGAVSFWEDFFTQREIPQERLDAENMWFYRAGL